ncbi:hypothetical protein N7478_008817 [Penicillium angulare]|uniref:uncharacterized protein n=1 Tax=Penicillium angulare TaxID=116970 RepID=UPI0025423E3D|nr:uncharacterized protein N7478_008817 [Penicillium angulare]KAJ5273692.1 hypothetical protein N7478_008817 [Penicillium angulare]
MSASEGPAFEGYRDTGPSESTVASDPAPLHHLVVMVTSSHRRINRSSSARDVLWERHHREAGRLAK